MSREECFLLIVGVFFSIVLLFMPETYEWLAKIL